MTLALQIAIVSIISALILYSIGVWSERFAGVLKAWHLAFFWLGFIADTTGTTMMGEIAGHFQFNIHGITGILAIVLMLVHAVWASVVLWKKDDRAAHNFHKFSVFVWTVWLIPFITGFILAME